MASDAEGETPPSFEELLHIWDGPIIDQQQLSLLIAQRWEIAWPGYLMQEWYAPVKMMTGWPPYEHMTLHRVLMGVNEGGKIYPAFHELRAITHVEHGPGHVLIQHLKPPQDEPYSYHLFLRRLDGKLLSEPELDEMRRFLVPKDER